MASSHLHSRAPVLPSLRWPVLFALLAAIVFFVCASTVRETYRGWKVDQEIEGLKNQVAQLESQKHSMTALLDTMQTDSYVEQEARLRFNLKRPGERVVLFDEGTANQPLVWSETGTSTAALAQTAAPQSIPKRWLSYFIGGSALHL